MACKICRKPLKRNTYIHKELYRSTCTDVKIARNAGDEGATLIKNDSMKRVIMWMRVIEIYCALCILDYFVLQLVYGSEIKKKNEKKDTYDLLIYTPIYRTWYCFFLNLIFTVFILYNYFYFMCFLLILSK